MAIPSRWLITQHATQWAAFDLKIVVQTDVDCHLTMRYQQHGIEPHFRTKMVRGVPQTRDPHLAFDNYLDLDENVAGDHKTHRFTLPFPYICKTYYWKFVGTIGGVWSPSHSPVFSEHLKEVPPVTKEIYFPVLYENGANWFMRGTFSGVNLTVTPQYAGINFYVPDNFTSLAEADVIVIPNCSVAEARWFLTCQYAKEGEPINAHHEWDNTTRYNVSSKKETIFKVPCRQVMTELERGDFGGLQFYLAHSEHDVLVLGLRIKYD